MKLPPSHASLMVEAARRWGHIEPPSGGSWAQSFTEIDGHLAFWFNDADDSTHVILAEKSRSAG